MSPIAQRLLEAAQAIGLCLSVAPGPTRQLRLRWGAVDDADLRAQLEEHKVAVVAALVEGPSGPCDVRVWHGLVGLTDDVWAEADKIVTVLVRTGVDEHQARWVAWRSLHAPTNIRTSETNRSTRTCST